MQKKIPSNLEFYTQGKYKAIMRENEDIFTYVDSQRNLYPMHPLLRNFIGRIA